MNKINLSSLNGIPPEDFGRLVSAFATEMNTWRDHMRMVMGTEYLEPGHAERHEPYPAPSAPPVIVSAVTDAGDKFVSDYEIVDDGPTPEEVLRNKKNALVVKVSEMELAAVNEIIPIGKRRLHAMNLEDAMSRKSKAEASDGTVDPEDQKIVDYGLSVSTRMKATERHAAELHSKIEDLTEADVDSWQPPEFPRENQS